LVGNCPELLFTSVLTLGEIRKGIDLLPSGRKRAELERWFEADLNSWFGKNLLPVTRAISTQWGSLTALMQQRGKPVGTVDAIIAATAMEHNLTVVTRNTRHFAGLAIDVLNPKEG
jgi:predicted nucleic acid-binding protein